MEQIRNYVEALFSSLPKTRDIVQMKCDMLEGLEEKFNALRAAGKNENEAVGLVLATIGSAEDLRRELGLASAVDTSADAPIHAPAAASAPPVTDPALLAEFRTFKTKLGIAIAIAVALFILSPIPVLALKQFGIAGMFVMIAIGVGICIYWGTKEEYYEQLLGTKEIEERHGKWSGLFASIAFPIATILFLFLGFWGGWWHPGWVVFPICAIITGGIEAFEKFRQNEKI